MQRKPLKKYDYNAGRGKTNQDLIYLHMSNHYRRILNAKKVIDNSPPHSCKTKRPATSNPTARRTKPNRPLESPALTDRSISTNSYKGSCWGTESYLGSSRYHTRCIPDDSHFGAPEKPIGIDMDLIDRITYDTKNGPAAYCDEGWAEVKALDPRKLYPATYNTKQSKTTASSHCKNRQPNKSSEEPAQNRKFLIQKKLKSDMAEKGNKCFASVGSNRCSKILKTEPVSKLRSLRVYHPPRRKKNRNKTQAPSSPLEAPNCKCTKICICDANETVFKKASPVAKEQSQTSSRDSAYNGGVSSLPESRSPTPDHRKKKECCCCCCEKKQRDVKIFESASKSGESPREPDSGSCPPTPKSKPQQQEESLKKMKEDALYVKFIQDITVEVLERNLYTNKALKKVMKKHVKNNLGKLSKERMLKEVENLRIQLGIPEDKTLLDLEGDDEGSADLKPYPVIYDSEFVMPGRPGVGQTSAEPRSISEVLASRPSNDKVIFTSETDEEEVISVIQMKKAAGEKRREKCGGKTGQGIGRENSSDDSDCPTDPKKRSTAYDLKHKQKMIRTYSSSSSESEMLRKKFSREKAEGKTSGLPGEGLAQKSLGVERKSRSVSFWNNPDVNVSATIEIKQQKTCCSRESGEEETKNGKPKKD